MSVERPNIGSLQERVERLEAQNRQLKSVGLAVLLLLGASMLMGQSAGDKGKIEAQELVLRDADGRLMASLGTLKQYGMTMGPALRFYDSDGKVRASFGFPDGSALPSLNFFNGDETLRTRLDVQALTIAPQGGSGVGISLMSAGDGSGGLNIDKVNKPTKILLTLARDGSPMLFLGDKTGKAVMGATALGRSGELATKLRPTSSLGLFGPNWEPLWEAPQLESKQPK